MYSELFSKRLNLRPTPEGLVYENVPETARIGLYQLFEKYFGKEVTITKRPLAIYQEICIGLRIAHKRYQYDYYASVEIENIINICEWWQFYDICEVLWVNLYSDHGRAHLEYSQDLNVMLKEEHLGYQLREARIEKVSSDFIDAKIQEARYLLKEPEFKGADQLFEKAIRSLNIRPTPDVENSIKDSVSAIESIGRIIIGDEKPLLDNIVKELAEKGVIPKPLDQVIQKLYAYRGNEPAIAHGAPTPSKVTIYEAEFVLALSAASIIYLIGKSGFSIK
jgi:hypothetical protein